MSDESFLRQLRGFATEYIESKRKSLQAGKPQTQVDGGGSSRSVSFSGQEISRDDLLKIKDIRESGGIITSAYDAKALVRFGTGVEVQTDNDDLKNWITENLPTLELLVLEMGEDATYYPYSVAEVVETRTGEFSHIEHIEPWTMLPKTDKFGDIIGWEQQLSGFGNTQSFDSDEIGHIVLNKSSGRDKTGISDVLQNKEEIETFRSNQQAMRKATARLGYPFVHVKAGREGAAQLNDNELRRIRNRVADIGPGETQVTGPDIDIGTIESATVDFGAIQERDTRMLSNALGLPIEMLNEGSDGLGSGKPAEARLQLFALQNEAARRRFSDQFKREFLDEILAEYSPFNPEAEEYGLHIKSFLDDKSDVAGLIQQVGDYMSANEVREKLDMPPVEDDEIGGSYRTPAEEEAPDDAGGGGLFGSALSDTDFRSLAEGYPISDRSECDGQVIEGPQGGLRCIPPGESGDKSDTTDGEVNAPDEESAEQISRINEIVNDDMADWKKRDELSNVVEDNTPVGSVRFDDFTPEQASQVSETLVRLNATDQLNGLNGVTSGLSESTKESTPNAAHVYKSSRASIELSPQYLDEKQAQEWADSGHLAGDSVEHMIAHEVGHHQHFEQDRAGEIDMSEIKDTELTPQEEMMAEQELSTYAATSTREFVAEAYAIKAGGGELSGPLQDMYEDFGGVEPV